MKTCKACMKEIDKKARKCPYCQTDQRNFFRRHVVLTGLGIFIFVIILVASTLVPSEQNENMETNPTASSPSSQQLAKKGDTYQSYDGNSYSYEILYEQNESSYVASFQPFIPKDDRNLLEAALEVFKTTYGSESRIDPTPILEPREGGNVIKFKATAGEYYVILPVKENSGEVHSIVYWKE